MTDIEKKLWDWQTQEVAWQVSGESVQSPLAIVLIHGFGACKEHWRGNQEVLGQIAPCYAIDLIGFGNSSQPESYLKGEERLPKSFYYCFDNWSEQIVSFCNQIIKKPVILIGNSIGGVIALNASKSLSIDCKGVILIDCAQRIMDDKRLSEQPLLIRLIRPLIKKCVRQRFLSKLIFKNAAKPSFIKNILKIAYPSGSNINNELIDILYRPTQRVQADEAFRGFINLFNDHLAPEIMKGLNIPIDLIWGEKDPWEPIGMAQDWYKSINCIRSLEVIPDAGHCPHDEKPEIVNKFLINIIQQAI